MRRIRFWQVPSALLIILLLSGCARASHVNADVISQEEAIDAALKIASNSRPEISGSQVAPSNIRAEIISLGDATKRIGQNSEVASGYAPDMLVWLITMDGIWLDEFPRPPGSPTPEPYRHYAIIIDAQTGLEMESTARP